MEPLKQCDEFSAISTYCLTVLLLHFQKLLLHHIHLFYKLRYNFGAFKLISQWCQIWDFVSKTGFSMPCWVSGCFFRRSVFFTILSLTGDL